MRAGSRNESNYDQKHSEQIKTVRAATASAELDHITVRTAHLKWQRSELHLIIFRTAHLPDAFGQRTEMCQISKKKRLNSSLAGGGWSINKNVPKKGRKLSEQGPETETFRIRAKMGRTGHRPDHKIARDKNMANNTEMWRMGLHRNSYL